MPMQRSTPRFTGAILPAAAAPHGGSVTPRHPHVAPHSMPARSGLVSAPSRPIRANVPVQRRPWTLLFVPPTPDERTRAFALRRWQVRAFLGGIVVLVALAASAVTAVIIVLGNPDVASPADEVAVLRERLRGVEDSLALARAALVDGGPTGSAASVAPPPPPVISRPSPTAPVADRILARVPGPSGSQALPVPAHLEGLPVIGAIVSGFSSARRHPLLHVVRPHLGIDIAARRGTRVSAPADGRVTYVGRSFALGLTVEIAHSNGVSTRYAHLRSALVTVGEDVARGAMIATVGSSGLTTGPHLHYEVSVNGRQVNPVRFRLPQVGEPLAPQVSPSPVSGGATRNDSEPAHR